MPTPTSRPFNIQDAMILILITAVAFAAAREAAQTRLRASLGHHRTHELAVADAIGWFAIIESIGLIPLSLRRPRPAFRRLVRRPGTVAAIAVTSTVAFSALTILGVAAVAEFWAPYDPRSLSKPIILLQIANPLEIASAVGTCWLILVLIAGWNPEPSWIDRLGRFYGALWIALAVTVELLLTF